MAKLAQSRAARRVAMAGNFVCGVGCVSNRRAVVAAVGVRLGVEKADWSVGRVRMAAKVKVRGCREPIASTSAWKSR